MTNFRNALISAWALIALMPFAPTAARAGDAPAPVMQLPAIACQGPLASIKSDFRKYYDTRINIAKHFVTDQVDALKDLRAKIKGDYPAIRALMAQAADGSLRGKEQAMISVAKFEDSELSAAKQSFRDFSYTTSSWSGGGDEKWEERMDTQVLLSNGDYAVAACSEATYRYSDDLYPGSSPLRLCSILDLSTGTIWGETPKEALQLAGNQMDESDYTEGRLAKDYPMCQAAGGYRVPIVLAGENDSPDAKYVATGSFLHQEPKMDSDAMFELSRRAVDAQ